MYGVASPSATNAAVDEITTLMQTNPASVLTQLYQLAFNQLDVEKGDGDTGDLTTLSLDEPEQFSMSWTNFESVYENSLPLLPSLSASLTDADEATNQFWPTIARYGLQFNLLVLQKVATTDVAGLRNQFGRLGAQKDLGGLQRQGRLYAIDTTVFESVSPQDVEGTTRFTPATITLLEQDVKSKALTPIAVRVSGSNGEAAQIYVRSEATVSAWLYALLAAKTSITAFGIWLEHVYQLHLVTAAMQMTLYNNIRVGHPLYRLLAPQSDYLIPFDIILILLWSEIAPPTSVVTPFQLLELANEFAKNRVFFQDDPPNKVLHLGLREEDFSVEEPWDRYPAVKHLLEIWQATEEYVSVFVDTTYKGNFAVAADRDLQDWMAASANPFMGNIRGLPLMRTKLALKSVLTSFLHRITVHGVTRLSAGANPGLTFVPNFPPTLHDTEIPDPQATFDTKRLLEFLPKTGTIGSLMTFYFTFFYSAPYEPFVPSEGLGRNLFFPGGLSDPRNQALIKYRKALLDFIVFFASPMAPIQHWPLNIET